MGTPSQEGYTTNRKRAAQGHKVGTRTKKMEYEERLRKLNLPTLTYRRLRGDMIEVFKIVTNKYDQAACSNLFDTNPHSTRGHSYKLFKKRANTNPRKYSFTHRVINPWNSLPEWVVEAQNVKQFETRLDRFWVDHPCKYDFTAPPDYKVSSECVKNKELALEAIA